ncbi:Inosine-uridine nucleoside N-ribohydrolase [Halogranum amylolyticum]|uniref:Inosine-uridine nucleoside N-ribohydrolase n=1 Tax=Halogranum amylolyticum TaxID=660520 RepID=A0A1H8MTD5_9EURY|nr:nucleoside hydrolase [Halogranum amylolyticum]SEO20682.1 Inosine-uridine nucleoside N-ribohydrolase [Halogranum amylolyticum]
MNTKLLLDIDPGNDDAIALFIALAADDIDVVGITTVAGNTTVENATRNALSLLELVDRTDVPVAAGADRPFADELETAEHVHGPDGLPEVVREDLSEPTAEPIDTHAVDFILDQADEHGDELTIAALGPQTNLALALAQDPSLSERVGDIYQMGGALKTTGNVTPQASFNFYVDAAAAARVVQDANPKVVGLDVTEHVYVDTEDIRALAEEENPLPTMAAILEFSIEEVRSKFGHDGGLASDAVVLADIVNDALEFDEAYVEIDTTGGPSNGATIYDEHGVYEKSPNCEVALGVDGEAYQKTVLEALRTFRQ